MRFPGLLALYITLWWNVACSLSKDDTTRREHGYPYNVDEPSILHKYDFDDPEVVFNPGPRKDSRDESDDIDYGTFEESRNSDDKRRFSEWMLRSFDEERTASEEKKTCETADCHETAEEIKRSLDPSVNPCEDFDEFACGGWRSNNPIPASQSQWTQFKKLWRHEESILRDLIEQQENSTENSSAALVYAWYSSCLNDTELKRRQDRPLLRLLQILGSSPMLNPFKFFIGWSFIDHLVVLNRFAIHPFFVIAPSNDLQNSSRVLLTISPTKPLLQTPNFYLLRGKYYKGVREAYVRMMIHVVLKLRHSLGVNHIGILSLRQQLYNMFKLEYIMARVLVSSKVVTYSKMTLNRLQREIPSFPWLLYIRKLYSGIKQKHKVTGNEMIAVNKINILKKIIRVLRLTSTSTRANFLMWNVAFRFIGDLSPDYEILRHHLVVAMYGEQKRKARWRECVSLTSTALSMAVGKLYVEKYFDENSQQKASKIIEDIRQQLIKDFESITWMDSKTKEYAEEKAHAIVKNIGYPKFILNETLVREYYKGMAFSSRRLLHNILKRRFVLVRNTLKARESSPNRERWSMSPQQINAYYSPQYNKIVFPAAILQPPFWKATYPMSMQYGGLGYVAGHEISHGFDVHGMHFDKHGNYFGWWTNASLNAYTIKSRCLSDQYSHYKIFGKNINGNLTLSENIADNGGIRLAFKAYQEWKKKNEEEFKLPGLSFTQEQLFFIKGAQMWCGNLRKKAALNSIDTDVHTPKMFRIIGPFSNFEDFAKTFKCPPNSKMNPEKKCRVW